MTPAEFEDLKNKAIWVSSGQMFSLLDDGLQNPPGCEIWLYHTEYNELEHWKRTETGWHTEIFKRSDANVLCFPDF